MILFTIQAHKHGLVLEQKVNELCSKVNSGLEDGSLVVTHNRKRIDECIKVNKINVATAICNPLIMTSISLLFLYPRKCLLL